MTRPLFRLLLLAIVGFTRIALADLDHDVKKAEGQLYGAIHRAVSDLVKKGERDAQTIESLASERTRTEQIKYLAAYTAREVQHGRKRSDAEMTAKETIAEMFDNVIGGMLSNVPEVSTPRK